MNGSSTSATPSLRCQPFLTKIKKIITFEFRKNNFYTQKGILAAYVLIGSQMAVGNPVGAGRNARSKIN